MSLTTTITSRNWDDVVDAEGNLLKPVDANTINTSNDGQTLLDPLTGWSAFSATFKVMFLEEWRKSIDFAKARQVLTFPLMLALITMVTTIGLQFLVGSGAAQSSDIDAKTFSWSELRFALHLPLFMFSMGMGMFAFKGRDAILKRTGEKMELLAAPALQPLNNSIAHFSYFIKDLVFYVVMILTPIIFGMALGLLLDRYTAINTPLEWSSLPWTWAAMVLTLAQGLAVAFLVSVLWLRGKPFTTFGPALVVVAGIAVGLGLVPWDQAMLGLAVQTKQSLAWVFGGLAITIIAGAFASSLILDDFDVHVVQRADLFEPIYNKLGFLGNSELRLLVAKEFVDLIRSGTMKKMLVSYAVPLLVLLGLAWLVDFAEFPIPFNLLSYAPFLGFFGFNFYSWLTILDSPDFMNGLPLRLTQLIRAKVMVYFIATSWISVLFFILMAWRLDEWISLPTGLIVMICNSIYIVALTAYLMGMRPNKAIFDSSIMIWFYLGTVAPLLMLFLLSFTQGDVALYGNWWDRVGQDGLEATSTYFDPEQMRGGYYGIIGVSGILLILSAILWKMMDRKWGDKPFEN